MYKDDSSPEESKETKHDDMLISMIFNKLRDKKAITEVEIDKMCMDMDIPKSEFFQMIDRSLIRLTKMEGRYVVRVETM